MKVFVCVVDVASGDQIEIPVLLDQCVGSDLPTLVPIGAAAINDGKVLTGLDGLSQGFVARWENDRIKARWLEKHR